MVLQLRVAIDMESRPVIIAKIANFRGELIIYPLRAEHIEPPIKLKKLNPEAAVPEVFFADCSMAPADAVGRINPIPRMTNTIGKM